VPLTFKAVKALALHHNCIKSPKPLAFSVVNLFSSQYKNISLNKMVLIILKRLLVSEATIRYNLHPQCFNRITAVSTYGHIAVSLHLETRDGYHARSSNTVILMNVSDEDE
jgi:hypothetical protein